jgi:hypothetical protein
MKRLLLHTLPLLLLMLLETSSAGADRAKADPVESQRPVPLWIADHPHCFSDDHETLFLTGSTGEKNDLYWEEAARSLPTFPQRTKVKKLLLNDGYISGASLKFFFGFENIETLRLGWSIEGVTVPPKDLMNLRLFKKLKHLNLALQGLNEDHLKVIAQLDGVMDLVIQFPSVLMIASDKLQKDHWRPVHLGDEVFQHIAKMKSLEALIVDGASQSKDEQVAFTEQGLQTLLKIPRLESLDIRSSNFTQEGLQAIKKMNLPAFVEIR